MKKVISLVGRPNVGKSTLFNRLTKSRDALVADEPGLTRDRRYGTIQYTGCKHILIDTGGITDEEGIDQHITEQAFLAIEESDAVILLVDGREGLAAGDEEIARQLRQRNKSVFVAVNKAEGLDVDMTASEFYTLGFDQVMVCSAAHGDGVSHLIESVSATLGEPTIEEEIDENTPFAAKVAIVGRPNVGKSTLVNRLVGEERVLAFDMPGTTRDSIYVPFEHSNNNFILIDTAGVRRRSRVSDKIEKFSIVKTLQAIEACNVAILVLDAQQGVSTQDANLLGYIIESGKPLLIAVNKWDNLPKDTRDQVRRDLDRKLSFIDFASVHYISALHGSGVGKLMGVVQKVYEISRSKFSTNLLTQILEDAVQAHTPPSIGGRRIKMRYAHQGGQNPPIIVIHGNQVDKVPESYKRYLSNTYRKILDLEGTPVRIEFRTSKNPFEGRKNKLSQRQINKKRRLMKHVKKNRR